ncbi:hypothetical protein [Iodidimonas nitroreducens]|uniref:hypothetical protein n=1 Tax=Iodidimonas nitroreducens TaxID=1236968 RepID=UPI00137863C3|nr:hypothetical protein [Iodidimonas nitroreducens]
MASMAVMTPSKTKMMTKRPTIASKELRIVSIFVREADICSRFHFNPENIQLTPIAIIPQTRPLVGACLPCPSILPKECQIDIKEH